MSAARVNITIVIVIAIFKRESAQYKADFQWSPAYTTYVCM